MRRQTDLFSQLLNDFLEPAVEKGYHYVPDRVCGILGIPEFVTSHREDRVR